MKSNQLTLRLIFKPFRSCSLAFAVMAASSLTACSNQQVGPIPQSQTEDNMASDNIVSNNIGSNSIGSNNIGSGISISDPYILPPFPGRDVAAAFFDLKNIGAPDRLISASSPDSKAVEIHNHIDDNGVMRMRRIDGLDLVKNSHIDFKPGSYHLMLFGVNFDAGQNEIDVTLNYEKAGPMTVTMPIRQRGEAPVRANGSGSDYGSDSGTGSGTGSGTDGKAEYGSGH